MSTFYVLLLGGVCVVVLAVIAEGVLSVSRRPSWATQRRELELVKTVDRRTGTLPFVGQDRREQRSRLRDAAEAASSNTGSASHHERALRA